MSGVITNGNCRDTDELILQKIPVYSKYQGGGTRPGRIETGAINRPVAIPVVGAETFFPVRFCGNLGKNHPHRAGEDDCEDQDPNEDSFHVILLLLRSRICRRAIN